MHCYLDLLQHGELNYSKAFIERHAPEHEDIHEHDIQIFRSLMLPAHIYENELAKLYRTNKYRLRLSKISFDLMLHLLQENETGGGKTIIRIINQYLAIQTTTSTPSRLAGGEELLPEREGIEGHGTSHFADFNKQPVHLGRLPMDQEALKEIEAELQAEDRESSREDGKSLAETFAAIKREDDGQDSPLREAIPLPPTRGVDVMAEVEVVKDLQKRLHLGPRASQPSVCLYTFHHTGDGLNCVDFSEDGSMMATGFAESYVKVWSLKGDALSGVDGKPATSSRKMVSHSGPVYAVDFSPDSRYLISCSEDRSARLWSLDTFTSLVAYKGHNQPVWDVAFGPFGHYFATASHDSTARLWSCDHIYPLRIFAGHLSDVNCVTFHPNSAYVATGSSDKTCRLWDVQRGSAVRVFTGHTAPVTTVAVSPDGKHLASAADDSLIYVWDIASGRPLRKFRGHAPGSSIYSLSFSKEGSLLLSGGSDNTVRSWDINRSINKPEANGEEHTNGTMTEGES